MAQLLYPRDSAQKHISATRRHMRLCKQAKNTQGLVKQITPSYDLLREKDQELQAQKLVREDRYDDMLMADNQLDDSVRNLFGKCAEFDRNFPGGNVLQQVFPEGKFSTIVNMNREEEPAAVEKLAMRLENLGEKHPLYASAKELRTVVEVSRKMIRAYQECLQVLKVCETECEMACTALRRQYENNYLDARKQLGRVLAERLFPTINSRNKSDKTSLEADETAAEALH